MRGCAITGCKRVHMARGYCHFHYKRLLRFGSPHISGRKPEAARFWAKVRFGHDCWQWLGAVDGDYGRFMIAGRRILQAHRYAYESLIGAIPEGLTLDHLCRNKLCVNPVHLEPVTALENHRRHYQARAEDLAKLTRGKAA